MANPGKALYENAVYWQNRANALKDRTEDFNNVIDSILSAGQGRNNVVIEKAMLEILREHRILNNAALSQKKQDN